VGNNFSSAYTASFRLLAARLSVRHCWRDKPWTENGKSSVDWQ